MRNLNSLPSTYCPKVAPLASFFVFGPAEWPVNIIYFVKQFSDILPHLADEDFTTWIHRRDFLEQEACGIDAVDYFPAFRRLHFFHKHVIYSKLQGNLRPFVNIFLKDSVRYDFRIGTSYIIVLIEDKAGLVVHDTDFGVIQTVKPVYIAHEILAGYVSLDRQFLTDDFETVRTVFLEDFQISLQGFHDIA